MLSWRALRQLPQAELDASQVLEDAHRAVVFPGQPPDAFNHGGVLLVGAMGEVQAAQSIPSVMSLLRVSSSFDDGPIVTMILVLRIAFVSRGLYGMT